MRSITVQIPQPCHERWDEMQPNERGRFCASCQKTVVDYSLLSDQEIIKSLSQSSGAICGRFCTDQLNRPLAPASSRRTSTWRNWISLLTLSVVSWQSAWAQRSTNQSLRPHSTQQSPERLSYSVHPILTQAADKPDVKWVISGRIMYVAPSGYLTPVTGIDVFINGIPSAQIRDTYQAKTDSSGTFTIAVPMMQQITQLKLRPYADGYRPKTVQIDASPISTHISVGDIIIRKIQIVKDITGGGLTIIQAPSPWQKVKRKLFR